MTKIPNLFKTRHVITVKNVITVNKIPEDGKITRLFCENTKRSSTKLEDYYCGKVACL